MFYWSSIGIFDDAFETKVNASLGVGVGFVIRIKPPQWEKCMKYQHIQRIYKNPFYVNFKKHFCPKCKGKLKKVKVSKIVNSSSKEAENFDFHTFDSYMIGNVKFIWTEFKCVSCDKNYTIEEMKNIEKNEK